MSRTLSAALAARLASSAHSRATMLRIDLVDGASIGITDHDRDIVFDLGDGALSYDSGTGILPSDVELSASLEADSFEVTGPLGDSGPVTRAGILGGRFNRARCRLFQVDWAEPSSGAAAILAGNVAQARVEGGRFVIEIVGDAALLDQAVGRLITSSCAWDYGDSNCGDTPTSVTGTVLGASSAMLMQVSFAGAYADNFFNLGTVTGLTGANAGVVREIFDWAADGSIELFEPLPTVPEPGDTFTVRNGCGKTRTHCMAHANIVNFGGFPEVPGSDQVLRLPIPGQGVE